MIRIFSRKKSFEFFVTLICGLWESMKLSFETFSHRVIRSRWNIVVSGTKTTLYARGSDHRRGAIMTHISRFYYFNAPPWPRPTRLAYSSPISHGNRFIQGAVLPFLRPRPRLYGRKLVVSVSYYARKFVSPTKHFGYCSWNHWK